MKNHYVYVGNDSYGRIFICLEEEQAYREPVVKKNKATAYLGVLCGMFLYGMRDWLVWPGMNGRNLAIAAVIIGFALGLVCCCLIDKYIQRIYAGKTALDKEKLELELLLQTVKKQQPGLRLCLLFLIGLSVVLCFFTIAEGGNLLFFIFEIMIIICSVVTSMYYQPWRRKKAIKLLKKWQREREGSVGLSETLVSDN